MPTFGAALDGLTHAKITLVLVVQDGILSDGAGRAERRRHHILVTYRTPSVQEAAKQIASAPEEY